MISKLVRPLLWSFAVAAFLSTSVVRAQPDDEFPDTFAYTTPTKKNYLRAFLELEGLTTISLIWYVIDVHDGHDVGYRWQAFQQKLTGASFAHTTITASVPTFSGTAWAAMPTICRLAATT